MQSRNYRSALDIIVDLLRASEEGGSKRQIMYRSHVDHKQGSKYIDFLQENGLLGCENKTYQITDRGLEVLSELAEAVDLVNSLELIKHSTALAGLSNQA